MTTSYTAGAATVSAGSRTVTGTGTAWRLSNIAPGFFNLDGDSSPVPVEEIVSDTELTLYTPWRGPSATDSAYWLSYDTRDGQQTVNNAQRLAEYISRLDNDSLAAVASLTPEDQMIILFTGPDTATLIPIGQVGGLFDAQVADIAARAAYDNRPEGFRVMVSNTGDGRSAIYTRTTPTAGVWSDPAYVTGPTGETGPPGGYTQIQAGNTTTLPAGSEATVTERQVSEGVVALDLGIPKGLDGAGTGDVVGPNGGTSENQIAGFSDSTGKLIKPLTQSQAIAATGAILGIETSLNNRIIAFSGTNGKQSKQTPVSLDDSGDASGLRVVSLSQGVKFPATANPSTDVNTLDDYREGTWTPILSQGVTPSTSVKEARYVKVGRLVTISMVATFSSGGTANNAIIITGLPFPNVTGAGSICSGTALFFDDGSQFYVFSCELSNAGQLRFVLNGASNYFGLSPAVTIASGDRVSLTVSYISAD